MKKRLTIGAMSVGCWIMAACWLLGISSCGNNQTGTNTQQQVTDTLSSDKTIYGLACDGCNDTIIVFLPLPYKGNDPDTLYVLEASRDHQVFGKIHIGDKLAMIRNEQNDSIADRVIVVENLIGQWCYKVLPTLRRRAYMDGQTESQIIELLPDTIKAQLNIEREYGIHIKNNNVAFAIGVRRTASNINEDMPIEYAEPRRYTEWHIHDGRLILSRLNTDSLGQQASLFSDTADFVLLTADTLVLRFGDEEKGFYRKK